MHRYEVVVGNVGTVVETEDSTAAQMVFDEYVQMSENGHGRASGESVVMLEDGDLVAEYIGENDATLPWSSRP